MFCECSVLIRLPTIFCLHGLDTFSLLLRFNFKFPWSLPACLAGLVVVRFTCSFTCSGVSRCHQGESYSPHGFQVGCCLRKMLTSLGRAVVGGSLLIRLSLPVLPAQAFPHLDCFSQQGSRWIERRIPIKSL